MRESRGRLKVDIRKLRRFESRKFQLETSNEQQHLTSELANYSNSIMKVVDASLINSTGNYIEIENMSRIYVPDHGIHHHSLKEKRGSLSGPIECPLVIINILSTKRK